MTDRERVRAWAEALHEALCDRSHIDQCDWTYGGWDRPEWRNDARKKYLLRAQRLMEQYPTWEIADLLRIHADVRRA